jgi:TRAP-type mannitol/chloroaromatic compound transport system substrate-binding protein
MLGAGVPAPEEKQSTISPANIKPRIAAQGRTTMTVSRRNFARIAAASAAVVSSPAIAQQATVKWRLASSFPKNLEGLWGASPTVAKFVNEMSDGKFEIQPFSAGEIVPGLQVLDAVQNGTVECGHSYSGY